MPWVEGDVREGMVMGMHMRMGGVCWLESGGEEVKGGAGHSPG